VGILERDDLISSHYTLAGGNPVEPARYDFATRVAAAAKAGFTGIGMHFAEYQAERAAGMTDGSMRAVLEDHGIGVPELEFIWGWQEAPGEQLRVEGEGYERLCYEMADAFGSRVVNVGDIGMPEDMPPLDDVTERFADLCDRAAEHGLLVALEFLPWSGIPDVATAWRIVDGAGRANGGLLVDTWHHLRGVADEAALRAVPGGRVFVVQVSDAPADPEGPYMEDTMLRRRLPGEGDLDLVGFLRTLEALGVDCPVSVELFNPGFQALPAEEAARLAHDATRALIAEARG
jgi:sugar phosphate isomerase/epimerase